MGMADHALAPPRRPPHEAEALKWSADEVASSCAICHLGRNHK